MKPKRAFSSEREENKELFLLENFGYQTQTEAQKNVHLRRPQNYDRCDIKHEKNTILSFEMDIYTKITLYINTLHPVITL